MADKKISELSALALASIVPGTDTIPVVNGGFTKKATIADIVAAGAPVSSVNGHDGVVTLGKSDVGLGNVDNTSDANKPVSTAQQTALDLKTTASTLAASGGSALVGFVQAGTGAIPRTAQAKARDILHAKDYCVCDGVADDWPKFKLLCDYARDNDRTIDIRDCKLLLASQDESVDSSNLFFQGSGCETFATLPVDWDLSTGTAGRFEVMVATLNDRHGSYIYSQYDGPIFTGTHINGDGFTVIGDPHSTSSEGFVQSTPTAYPGWSQAFVNLSNVTFAYFGGNGLYAKGGLELTELKNISAMFCNDYGLYVSQTTGINSPIEYLKISGGAYTDGLLGNIYLEGVSKHIEITDVVLNNPGQLGRRADGGFIVVTEADIVYPISLVPAPGALIILASNIRVTNCVAENSQGIVEMLGALSGFPFYANVVVENNYLIPQDNTWPYYHGSFKETFYHALTTDHNFAPTGTRFNFIISDNHGEIDIRERWTSTVAVTIDGFTFKDSQYIQPRIWQTHTDTLGDGTAGTFTSSLFNTLISTPVNKAAVPELMLVTASREDAGATTCGAYLLVVFRLPDTSFYGSSLAFGSTAGFTGAPTVATNGTISLPLAANHRGRIVKIDSGLLNPVSY